MPTLNNFSRIFFKPSESQIKLHFRRFEFKYPLESRKYHFLKSIIARRLTLDPFARKTGQYTVKSLYFDTPKLSSYQQTKAGLLNRVKYRIRSYQNSTRIPGYEFWEMKRKHDAAVIKDRSLFSLSRSQQLLKTYRILKNSQVVKHFQVARLKYLIRPTILIRYRREPFIGRLGDLRITFDSHIQATDAWFSDHQSQAWQTVLPFGGVMELKFTGSLPYWLAKLIRHHDLARQPFSKYTLSIEKTKSHLPWIAS